MNSALYPVYNRSKLQIEKGEGSYLFTKDGKRYLDFVSGIAVNCLGHCHPELVKTLELQANKLWQISNLYQIPGLEDFGHKLTELTFADSIFFCNSGAEAIECCIKTVRKYHDATGNPDKYRIITFEGAFHGRTLAAIWASKRDKMMQDGFGPPVEGFDNIPLGDLKAVEKAITSETAAILIEPIQGDGGIRVVDKEFLQGLRMIADKHGLLLCFDEIQCGMGRTGELFAYQYYGVTPDIMTSAKGIGGGFPLGACLASKKAASGMTLGTHGSTYGGNPLAMAVGKKVLEIISKPEFLKNVKELGEYLQQSIQKLAKKYPEIISETRGFGLIQGIKLNNSIVNKEFVVKLEDAGLLAPPASDNVIRLLPALNVTKEQIDEAMTIIETVCKN